MSAEVEHRSSHRDQHNHNETDPGSKYKEQWVQDLLFQLATFVQRHHDWVGIKDGQATRVLDYACGNGALSMALAVSTRNTTFRGIDKSAAQVKRFNDSAGSLHIQQRMSAVSGDLLQDDAQFASEEWFGFDVALISMALHHVSNPIDMLKRLGSRVVSGGLVVIAEFLTEETHVLDTEAHGKWPGFTEESLRKAMEQAGLVDIDVRLDPKPTVIPARLGGNKQIVYAKGRTISSD